MNMVAAFWTFLQAVILSCLVIVLAVVPLVAKLHVDHQLNPELGPMGFRGQWGDLFHWYKDRTVSFCALFASVAAIISLFLRPINLPKVPYLLLGGLGAVILLSWRLSEFDSLTLWGAPGTYEGVVVQLGYLGLAVSASALQRSFFANTIILLALSFGLVGVGFWGLPEVLGIHPLLSPWVQRHMLGIDYEQGFALTRSTHPYATAMFSHSNYMGTYSGMVGLVFLTLGVLTRRKKMRAIIWILATLALLLLLASFSRAAYGAAAVSCLALIISLVISRKIEYKDVCKYGLIFCAFFWCVGGILHTLNPKLASRLVERASSIWRKDSSPKPRPSFVDQNQDQIQLELEGYSLNIAASDGKNFVISTGKGQPVPLGYGGYEIQQTQVQNMPALFITRGALKVNVVLTPLGLRIFSRGALLRPQKALYTQLPISDDFANRRGFIWKRTLPLILAAPWFGYSPGTFMLHYPNRDFSGFLNTFGMSDILIDKPHNFYLQYAFYFGLLGLGIYLTLGVYVAMVTIKELKNFKSKGHLSQDSIMRLACLMGLFCFWGCGLTHDSMSGVTSISWIFLGMCVKAWDSVTPTGLGVSKWSQNNRLELRFFHIHLP